MDLKLLLTAVWTAAGTALCIVEPDATPFFLPLALVAPYLWIEKPVPSGQLLTVSRLSILLVVTSAYLLINATWSSTPVRAYIAAVIVMVLSLVLHALSRTIPTLGRNVLHAMAVGFYISYALCALLVTIEVSFDHPLHVAFFNAFPQMAPRMNGVISHDGIVQELPSFFLNRNVAMLVLLFWPVLLVGSQLSSYRAYRTAFLFPIALILPAIFLSAHESSKVAIIGGALTFFISSLVPRLTKPFLMASWVIACTAALPIASAAYELRLHHVDWLPKSAQHRIVIWAVTSETALDAPLLGHGMVSAREIGKEQATSADYAPGTNFQLALGPHAHNAYLEAWFDTGAVGVTLMLSIGVVTLLRIGTLSANLRPIFFAMFATIALLAASSFSLWSRWFIASFGVSVIFALLAWSLACVNAHRRADNALP